MGLFGKPSNLKGIPNTKPSRAKRLGIHMDTASYNRNRKRQRDALPYNGSEEQMQHRRIFWR